MFINVKLFNLWHYDNENDTVTMVLWIGYYLLKWRIFMLKKTKANSLAQSYIGGKLKNVYKMLMKLDIDNKSGNIDLYTGIINVMCTIK